MGWLWPSWQDYIDFAHPVGVNRPGTFRGAQLESAFERLRAIYEAFHELEQALRELLKLGYGRGGPKPPPEDSVTISTARDHVIRVVYAGERLLLYHRRLAQSDASYGFLHQHEILREWQRYESSGRIPREIDQLVEDTQKLVSGFHNMILEDSRFLVRRLLIPEELGADFDLARDLFSVGFDEVGLLIAGRAIEGILRHIAHAKKISVLNRGTRLSGQEMSFKDLIEAFHRIRLRKTNERILSRDMRALLDYVRELRNAQAHPARGRRRRATAPREAATIIAELANSLWDEIMTSKSAVVGTRVRKDW